MGSVWSQSFFIPAPTLTLANLPDQSGRVHIITGGYSGIGYELVRILYSRNATVFIAGRNDLKGKAAISQIEHEVPSSGKLEYLHLDLGDLSSIKSSVDDFLARSTRLDVLLNNAGVMTPPLGTTTKQDHELQIGVNCLGPYLFTQLLMPMLQRTAEIAPSGSVRVLWAGSVAVELAPTGGIPFTEAGEPSTSNDQAKNYSVSKTGNVLLAMETARRYHRDSIVSVAYNPGNLKTQLQRHMTWWQYAVARTILYPPTLGAYTMLFAGWSENMTLANSGAYVWPWGRIGALRRDICQAALAKTENGGEGLAERFWLWCEGKTAPYR